MGKQQLRREAGQALVFVALALPLFSAVALVVVDGSLGFVGKRQMQNASDAAALAAARELKPALGPVCDPVPCMDGVRTKVKATAESYSAQNGGPALNGGSGADPAQCAQPSDTNCYTWPYPSDAGAGSASRGKVEVRLQTTTGTFFTKIFGIAPGFLKPKARAVAVATGITETHCDFSAVEPPPVDNPDQYLPDCQMPGTAPVTGTYVPGVTGAQAFTMSRACDAISWAGSASGDPTLGNMGTNGGLNFQGASPKGVHTLGFNEVSASNPTGCASPPTPTPCTAIAWGDASDSRPNTCVKTLVDLSPQVPLNWQVNTSVPTPSATWNASTDYPSKCKDLGANSMTFTPASGTPGIYCLTGSNKTLSLNGDFTSGDGYTFFALNDSSIAISSNGTKVKFYWPSGSPGCGARVTGSTRPASYTCFGRTVTGYDAQAMLYATNPLHASCAVCITGGGASLNGDIFAMSPSTFPPPTTPPALTTTGGLISMAGNSASAGSGFLQSWWLTVNGNNGSYTGTGPSIAAHCVFNPPVVNPDQYLPSCVIPGSPGRQGTPTTTVTGANLNMDE